MFACVWVCTFGIWFVWMVGCGIAGVCVLWCLLFMILVRLLFMRGYLWLMIAYVLIITILFIDSVC